MNSAAGAAPSTKEAASGPGADFSQTDVCHLATTDEVTAVTGETAHDPQPSVIGPGAGIDGAAGCSWPVGDSIDFLDVWIYPSANEDVKTALANFWASGYQIEPIAGVGDQAYAAVWRGDPSTRTVGEVAGVGVRQGGKAILISTTLVGEDYLDPNPAAQLALKILGRF
jgi:hypothetical protein